MFLGVEARLQALGPALHREKLQLKEGRSYSQMKGGGESIQGMEVIR